MAGRSPVDRGTQGWKRSGMTDGYGIPLGRVLAGANCRDSPLLAPTLDRLGGLGPLPDEVTVHLDAGYDSNKIRTMLDERGLHGRIAHTGEKAPIQASRRWHVERTHAWQNAFHRLARCYERRARRQRILRPHRHDHHRAQPDPASMDDSPDGRTPEPPTMIAPLSGPPLGRFRLDDLADQRKMLATWSPAR